MPIRSLSFILSLLVLFFMVALPAAAHDHPDHDAVVVGDIEAGRALAKENCSACHAISGNGPSPNRKAPLFKNITKKYPAEYLEEAFAEGVIVGKHGREMPEFELDEQQIADLTAYLESIGPRPMGR